MKKGIIIYLIGFVCSYFYTKYNIMQYRQGSEITWTEGDRCFALTISVASWANVGAMAIVNLVAETQKMDEKATW